MMNKYLRAKHRLLELTYAILRMGDQTAIEIGAESIEMMLAPYRTFSDAEHAEDFDKDSAACAINECISLIYRRCKDEHQINY